MDKINYLSKRYQQCIKSISHSSTKYSVIVLNGANHKNKKNVLNDIALARQLPITISKGLININKLTGLLAEKNKQEGILFFDEADALFGKRSAVRNSHNRFANQQNSHLLECLKRHQGLVIISLKTNTHINSVYQQKVGCEIHFPFVTKRFKQFSLFISKRFSRR